MKLLVNIARVFVGVLFIFSGLIKANDPLGLSYKMQEFFEVWGWNALNDSTLVLSIIMNVFEVVAGIALLIGWNMKLISRLLLLLIIFFTFLTGYALLSGKIKTCGCFGDCLPLTPLQSFLKDLLLLVLIVFILMKNQLVKPVFAKKLSLIVLALSVVVITLGQFYALKHLPFIDCLPYKKGNNIVEKMKVPEGALPDSFSMYFSYKKAGKIVEFDQEHFPDDFDSTYEFVERKDKLIRKGNATPAIIDFALRTEAGADTTLQILNKPDYYVLLCVKDFADISRLDKATYNNIAAICRQKNITLFYVTASPEKARQYFGETATAGHILVCDATIIKTIVRANPSYVLMKQANVLEKYSYADADQFLRALQKLP